MRHGGNKANVRDETMRVCFGCRLLLLGQGFDSQGNRWHLEGPAPSLWARNEWAKETLTDYLTDMLDGDTFERGMELVFGRDKLRWPTQMLDLLHELKLGEDEMPVEEAEQVAA
jgi:hypothetical protein